MTSLASILALGFLLGLRHATDPDHVVAVTTIVARERQLRRASLIGALWGTGHSLTLFVLGGALVAFRMVVPPRVGLALELTVAAMLIVLGASALSRPRATGRAALAHAHGPSDVPVGHAHESPSRGWSMSPRTSSVRGQGLRSLAVGVVHGLAGSGAASLLVLSTIADARWALVYLGVFGAGTFAGMVLLTTAIALPFTYAAARFARWSAWLARGTGLASVTLGVVVAYQLIALQGALAADPQWVPR
jgi:high-affinity nickel-transport protein